MMHLRVCVCVVFRQAPLWVVWWAAPNDEADHSFLALHLLVLALVVGALEAGAVVLHRALVDLVRGTWFAIIEVVGSWSPVTPSRRRIVV